VPKIVARSWFVWDEVSIRSSFTMGGDALAGDAMAPDAMVPSPTALARRMAARRMRTPFSPVENGGEPPGAGDAWGERRTLETS